MNLDTVFFLKEVASIFYLKRRCNLFGKKNKYNLLFMDFNIFAFEMQGKGKQVIAASCADSSLNSVAWLYCLREQWRHFPLFRQDWVWFKAQNALNWVQPSKIKNKNYFLFFNCVLFEKLVFNIIY